MNANKNRIIRTTLGMIDWVPTRVTDVTRIIRTTLGIIDWVPTRVTEVTRQLVFDMDKAARSGP